VTTDIFLKKVVFTGWSLISLVSQFLIFTFSTVILKNNLEISCIVLASVVSIFLVIWVLYKKYLDIDQFLFNILLPVIIYLFFKLNL